MKAALSLTFTSTRMRQMFELVIECTENMIEHLVEESKQHTSVHWEMEELFNRYASDVNASAIGLKVNSFKHCTNDFYSIVTKNVNQVQSDFKTVLIRALPRFVCDLTFGFSSAHAKRFFKLTVRQEMKDREKEQTFRPDVIDVLMQMREHPTIDSNHVDQIGTDDAIITSLFQFFADGLKISPILSFISFELAMHQDVQQKLHEEILETSQMLDGARISCDLLSSLQYFDQVISKMLRKCSMVKFVNRKSKNYEFCLDGNKIMVERGQEESQFVQVAIKTLLYYLLLNFTIEANKKIQIPIRAANSAENVRAPTQTAEIDLKLRLRS